VTENAKTGKASGGQRIHRRYAPLHPRGVDDGGVWMLWADLSLQLMENLPNIIPLQLKWLGASDRLIGFVKDSLQAILTLCYVPVIGMQSDRHRGPLGRRRPFLLWCSIPVCLFLVCLGFAERSRAPCKPF